MKYLGFALLLLLWLALVGVGYVVFGWWMLLFATLGMLWPIFKIKAQRDAARKAAAPPPDDGGS